MTSPQTEADAAPRALLTAVLLCDPAAPVLSEDHIDWLRRAWGGGAERWLARGAAAEFGLSQAPLDLDDRWETLQRDGIDLALLPAAGRRKRLLLADMDSTMIRQECVDELAALAGVGDAVAEITSRAMNGEIDFAAALRARVALLAGLDAAVIDRVLSERISFTRGGRTLVATMRANGAHTVLVSGGFTAFTGPVSAALGFDENRANVLEVADGRLTGRVAEPILGREAKVAALDELADRLRLSPDEVLAVGDGANDLGMLQKAGMGVALHAKPAVAAQCRLRLNHGDLTALLHLQGYSEAEFVDQDTQS